MFSIASRHRMDQFLVGSAVGAVSCAALAGNGLNDIAFGAQGAGMAGADLAVSRDTNALNVNPAGLTQIKGTAFDFYVEPFINLINRHTDGLGNDQKLDQPYSAPIGGGYATRLKDYGLVAGMGFFAQGGSGFTYKGLNTPFGTEDDLSSSFGTVKLVPGLAWQLGDSLSVGLSLGINYSLAKQEFFPDTSFVDAEGMAPAFQGFRVDSLSGWSFNGKAGFQFRPDPQWVIAGAYTSETEVRLESGNATFNYDADGIGRVRYREASQSGLSIAQEAGIGVSFAPNEAWLIALEANWLDWSSALKRSVLTVSNPNSDQVPQSQSFSSTLAWRDQYVFAIGAENRWSERTTIRFGFNYGRNPIPDRTLNPALPLIGETIVAAGFTRKLSGPWEFSSSVWYQLPIKVRYTNPESPFGPDATESWDGLVVHLMTSRSW